MKVYFSHGQESGPRSSKIKRLAAIAREHCTLTWTHCFYYSLQFPHIRVPDMCEPSRRAGQEDNLALLSCSSNCGTHRR